LATLERKVNRVLGILAKKEQDIGIPPKDKPKEDKNAKQQQSKEKLKVD